MAIILEVGTNTYVTLEEAESMLEAVYDNAEWKLLTDEQKKVCLVNATNKINLLTVKGSKRSHDRERGKWDIKLM